MEKIIIFCFAVFACLTIAADPISVVNVKNATECVVIDFNQHKIVPPGRTFYSFYYDANNQLTKYSTIAPNTGGLAAIGPNPYVTPKENAIILGFSAPKLISNVPPPDVYVYREILSDTPICTPQDPCLDWSVENPCN